MYYIINIVLQRTILNESIAAILTLYQYTNIFTVSCPKKKTVTVEQVPIEFNIDFSISLDFSFVFWTDANLLYLVGLFNNDMQFFR